MTVPVQVAMARYMPMEQLIWYYDDAVAGLALQARSDRPSSSCRPGPRPRVGLPDLRRLPRALG